MKESHAAPPPGAAGPTDDLRALLDQLASLVSNELAAADGGDYEALPRLATQIEGLVKQVIPFDRISPQAAQQIRRVMDDRRKLALKLALEKKETAVELARLRRGRTGLRGYRNGAGK